MVSLSAPRLVSCVFHGASPIFHRLARVLEHSARTQCPGWTIEVRAFAPALCRSATATAAHEHNTQKLDHWASVVAAAADGDRLLLIDADTAILRPLDDVWERHDAWERPFDVAYTVRPAGCRLPLNAGVVFVRVTARSRAFLARWQAENRRMLTDVPYHQEWRRCYGGINQAAFGAAMHSELAAGPPDGWTRFAPLPCAEWNCEDSTWAAFDPDVTRILHVKSLLRRVLFFGGTFAPRMSPLVARWRQLEHAALAGKVQSI